VTQEALIDSLPEHLRPFVKHQNYQQYTPQDQAAWRFIMSELTHQLTESAHPVYLEGLAKTGISLDHIPSIEEMNDCLRDLDWRAVVVDGFIPPAIFMEFQALKILVIALDMRSADHLLYTPAPDIVHESAGHAPFIVDIDYAEFLQRFGEVGMKAISTKADLEQYEVIRQLSILKACPESKDEDIAQAEQILKGLRERDDTPSEAALLTRLHWWTVEYGLVGSMEDYKIFGAGLLSSLGESQRCVDDLRVRKIPLTVNAVNTPYDITTEQPQLFVTKSCKHLTQVLEEFAASMCFVKGGAESVQKAIEAESVCTAVYDSGLQVSGRFSEVLCDVVGNATYIRTEGPTQIAYKDKELSEHGVDTHAQGFGSPVGRLKDFHRCLSEYSVDELKTHGIRVGETVELEYLSGITVRGILREIVRHNHRNLLLSFEDCSVTDLDGRVLFSPDWGVYDLAVGSTITSVFGGVADREKRQLFRPTPSGTATNLSHDENLMKAYSAVADLHTRATPVDVAELTPEITNLLSQYPNDWLIRSELLNVAAPCLKASLHEQLRAIVDRSPDSEEMIRRVLGR
jgi:phenylalanine-4-hydroxylase